MQREHPPSPSAPAASSAQSMMMMTTTTTGTGDVAAGTAGTANGSGVHRLPPAPAHGQLSPLPQQPQPYDFKKRVKTSTFQIVNEASTNLIGTTRKKKKKKR